MKIAIKVMNNKSRKGTYIYIKEKKAKGAYFKLKDEDKTDPFLAYYKDKYIKKTPKGSIKEYVNAFKETAEGTKGARTSIRRSAEQYLKKVKKGKKIDESIAKGISYYKVRNALTSREAEKREAKEKLFSRLVYDKELLGLLITDENLKKISHRFEYKIRITDRIGTTLATTTGFLRTPDRAIEEIRQNIHEGEEIKYDGFESSSTATMPTAKRLEAIGYEKLKIIRTGTISGAEITIVFRKGK